MSRLDFFIEQVYDFVGTSVPINEPEEYRMSKTQADYEVVITVKTNVPVVDGAMTGLDAINLAMDYGLSELLVSGEYKLVNVTVERVAVEVEDQDDDEEDQEDGQEEEEGEEDQGQDEEQEDGSQDGSQGQDEDGEDNGEDEDQDDEQDQDGQYDDEGSQQGDDDGNGTIEMKNDDIDLPKNNGTVQIARRSLPLPKIN